VQEEQAGPQHHAPHCRVSAAGLSSVERLAA
jgi:hypothetical protein